MRRLLLIDDDQEVLGIHGEYFTGQGYEVQCAHNAKIGLQLLERQPFDCILLDVMMPEQDGFEACRRIRSKTSAPILFLSGRLDEDSKVRGLTMGADDYIAKPCGLAELEARVAANIRRSDKSSRPANQLTLRLPPLEIDVVAHQAYCDGENLQLTGREYDILYLLASHEGETVTYEQFALQMWGVYREDDRRTVIMNVSRLRKKMEAYSTLKGFIETVWSTGYKLAGRGRHG